MDMIKCNIFIIWSKYKAFIMRLLCIRHGQSEVHGLGKGPFKYYVIKEVCGRVCQMMMFNDKVGGGGGLNADVIKRYTRKKTLFACAEKKVGIFFAMPTISIKTYLKSIYPFEDITDQFNSSD